MIKNYKLIESNNEKVVYKLSMTPAILVLVLYGLLCCASLFLMLINYFLPIPIFAILSFLVVRWAFKRRHKIFTFLNRISLKQMTLNMFDVKDSNDKLYDPINTVLNSCNFSFSLPYVIRNGRIEYFNLFNKPRELNVDNRKIVVLNRIDYSGEIIQCSSKKEYRELCGHLDTITTSFKNDELFVCLCLLSRNFNGFIRQYAVTKILKQTNIPDYALVFIIAACSDYVVEILEVLNKELSKVKNKNIVNKLKVICKNNQPMIKKQYQTMKNYWTIYYQSKILDFHNYVGLSLFNKFLLINTSFH